MYRRRGYLAATVSAADAGARGPASGIAAIERLVFLIGLAGYVMTSRRHLSDAISEGTEEGDGPRAESEAADRPNEMAETSVSAGPEPQEAHTKSEMKPDAGD